MERFVENGILPHERINRHSSSGNVTDAIFEGEIRMPPYALNFSLGNSNRFTFHEKPIRLLFGTVSHQIHGTQQL